MKNQTTSSVRSLVAKMVTPAALAFMLVATSANTANAAHKKNQAEIPVEVKYLGQNINQPVFQVNIANDAQDEIFVSFRDNDGNVLYTDSFKDRKFSKKFQFNTDPNDLKVTMTLTSKSDKKSEVLQFTNVTKTVEDVVVTKVK